MKLSEALPLLESACGKRFGILFAGHPDDLVTNKGDVGQLLMRYIGLKLDSNITDFEDGELKTNKSRVDGMPIETMWIRQISSEIDTLIGPTRVPFGKSSLYTKISNLVYLPVVKESSNASDWYFVKCVHVQNKPGSFLFARLEEDYNLICAGLEENVRHSADGFIHTTNGMHYLQVRSKDGKDKNGNYHPIYSRAFGRYVSNKNHGFYFMKPFMIDAANGLFK